MPCENQKDCDFYRKMLPLFKEVLSDLPQFNSEINDYKKMCETGLLNEAACDGYKIKICQKYPCSLITFRKNLDKEGLHRLSINTCFLNQGNCMYQIPGNPKEAGEKALDFIIKNHK